MPNQHASNSLGATFPTPEQVARYGKAPAAFRHEVHTYPSAASRLLQTHVFKESLLLPTQPHLGAAVLPRLRRWLQVSSERLAGATAAAVATGILPALGRPPFPSPGRLSLRPPRRACSAEPEPRGRGSPAARLHFLQWHRRRQQQVERASAASSSWSEIHSSCPGGSRPAGLEPVPGPVQPLVSGELVLPRPVGRGRSRGRGRARPRAQGSRGIRVRDAGPRGPGSSRLPEDLFSRDLGAARGLPGHLAGRSRLAPGWRGRVPSGAVGSPVWLRRGRQGALPWDSGATGAVHAVLRGVLAALAVLSREARRLTLICRSSLLIWFLPRFGDSSRQRRPTHLFSQTSRSPRSPEPAGILAPFADPQGAFRLAYLFCPPFEGVRCLRGTTAS